jgi:hypothetical protein
MLMKIALEKPECHLVVASDEGFRVEDIEFRTEPSAASIQGNFGRVVGKLMIGDTFRSLCATYDAGQGGGIHRSVVAAKRAIAMALQVAYAHHNYARGIRPSVEDYAASQPWSPPNPPATSP